MCTQIYHYVATISLSRLVTRSVTEALSQHKNIKLVTDLNHFFVVYVAGVEFWGFFSWVLDDVH